ncbi:hypothetical protein CPB83DRAFT_852915 [Crepidotus variabilis]|uniref:IPT/TIG domain-containing protein n=1 Tax=Crepidotus variabilis TaxID=179855 RepID=A0A9P6EGN6_9AGAR|nr:hypothetical protein CPB83DRAFT_852915 [Crepidotus variabilis]
MSTTSTTSPESRSPSPRTPGASEVSELVSIHDEIDQATAFFIQMQPKGTGLPWVNDSGVYTTPHKQEDDQMLRLDELIEQHAYEDSPAAHSPLFSSPPTYHTTLNASAMITEPASPNNILAPSQHASIPLTKPIPPPASLLRKPDPSANNQRVVHPPRESCFNLPIMFPSIPEGGTKSRVETQVRITIDLADSSSSSDPYRYNKVGSWKWLQLPHGTATKKRTRKQGKIDPELQDVLHLSATVTCATPPHNRVLSCSSCQTREAKRVAKKLAARVRPTRSDSESEAEGPGKPKSKVQEDTTSIIQFNCAEHLDFSTGSIVLPLRITCYCRHHREKVGFNVHFTLMDHNGRLVGSGITKPIMITDDHKTSTTKVPELMPSYPTLDTRDWSQMGGMLAEVSPGGGSHTRKKSDINGTIKKRRDKPYDSLSKPTRASREGTASSVTSPSTTHSPLPTTRASTPSLLQALAASEAPPLPQLPPHFPLQDSETSSPDTLATPLDNNSDVPMPQISFDMQEPQPEHQMPPLQPSSALLPPQMVSPDMSALSNLPHPMPFLFFDPNQSQIQMQLPVIHRLIPSAGPTYGGIEVTILGANFHTLVQLNCMFGDVAATATQRWSDNTLVCILPPRAAPGVVPVWFDGFPKTDDNPMSPLFTYSDESDRALMELALQVVGLKMTGKIEDAKNVAMRIVGNTGNDGSDANGGNTSGMMQLASSQSVRDLRPLLLARTTENDSFESRLVQFLSIVDTPMEETAPRSLPNSFALSHPSSSGQTLLHMASFLGFGSLTHFLIEHGADLDARDRNGFTPLHFAVLASSTACADLLVKAGADVEVVNSLGKTAQEIATSDAFNDVLPRHPVSSEEESSEDDDADFGDAEDDEPEVKRKVKRRLIRKTSRLHSNKSTPQRSVNVSRAVTPPPASMNDEKPKRSEKEKEAESIVETDAADAKRAASFMEKMIQRTLAQIPGRPDIMPNIPQLPLPHLPDFPAVPWGALPQIPMVFPVFVPMMPNWPSFRGGNTEDKVESGPESDDVTKRGVGLRAAQEWRGFWEKWMAMAMVTTARQQTEDIPPPVYTPRVEDPKIDEQDKQAQPLASTSSSTARRSHPETRPVGYDDTPLPAQVVESFGYQPNAKQTRRLQKKHDKMLLVFWLPILLLSIIWAFHHGFRFVLNVVRTASPLKAAIRS